MLGVAVSDKVTDDEATSDLERVDVTEFVLEAERLDDTAFDTDDVTVILADSERLIETLADSEDDTDDDAT